MVAARIANLQKGANQHAQICAPSQADAAEMMNVGRRSVQHARVVQERAILGLISACDRGRASAAAGKAAETLGFLSPGLDQDAPSSRLRSTHSHRYEISAFRSLTNI